MKKVRSMLLSLAIALTVGLIFQPTLVRAETGGPQNTSSSQSSGGSTLTLAQTVAILAAALRLW